MTTSEIIERGISPREYAEREGIALQTAYTRLWTGKVKGEKVLDRWLILPNESVREENSNE